MVLIFVFLVCVCGNVFWVGFVVQVFGCCNLFVFFFAFGFVVGVVRVCFGVLCFFDFFVCVFLCCFVCCALLWSLLLVCLKLYVIRCV